MGYQDREGDLYRRELARRDLALSTRAKYAQMVGAYLASLEGVESTRESALDYLGRLKALGYADKSYELYAYVLGDFLWTVYGQKLGLKVKRSKLLPPYVPWSSVERVLVQAQRGLRGHSPERGERNYNACAFLAFTGCRKSELLALRVRDVDFDGQLIHIRIGKGRRDRSLPMHERVVLPLRRASQDKSGAARVFESFAARSLYAMVTSLAAASGIDAFTPHSFRHAFATDLVARGVPVDRVQQLMGHESLDTTARYLGLTASHLREAIDVLGGGQPVPS